MYSVMRMPIIILYLHDIVHCTLANQPVLESFYKILFNLKLLYSVCVQCTYIKLCCMISAHYNVPLLFCVQTNEEIGPGCTRMVKQTFWIPHILHLSVPFFTYISILLQQYIIIILILMATTGTNLCDTTYL